MTVPGSNLLSQALRLITAQSIVYKAYASRTLTDIGTYVAIYATGTRIKGSVQPVPRQLMENLGLDMQRNYVNIFVSQAVVDIRRDVTGDQFIFGRTIYEAMSITPWERIDGWNQVLAVEVPRA